MLIKLEMLTSEQFAKLADFLASGDKNLVFTPKGNHQKFVKAESGGMVSRCTNVLFCKLVKATQTMATVNQSFTGVTLSVVTELILEDEDNDKQEKYQVPRRHLDQLLSAIGVMSEPS